MTGVEHVAVCLLTEKVLIKGRNLSTDDIKDMIENLGFEGNEIKEANILDGEVTFEFADGSNLTENNDDIRSALKKHNGITEVEFFQKPSLLIKITYTSEAIKAREISYILEDLTKKQVKVYDENTRKGGIIEKQQKTMRL